MITLPQPEPRPSRAAYEHERAVRLDSSLDCRINYDKFLRFKRGEPVTHLPIRLDIESVSRCNFACGMCVVSEWKHGKRADDMPLDAFKRIIDEQTGLLEVKIQGLGEPLLQGDDYFAMIRYARERHIWVRTTTNASLLHIKGNAQKLADSGVNEVQISIDGATQETFEGIRRQSDFYRVVDNCSIINRLIPDHTKMWTVVQKSNRHQLADLVILAAKMGFRSMVFSLELGDFGLTEWRVRNDEVAAAPLTQIEADNLVKLGRENGVVVAFWRGTERYQTDAPGHLCPWPFERSYIASDLRMVPCCIIGNPDVSDMGSVKDNVTDTWNGQTMQDFRKAHLTGNIPDVCKSCYRS